MNHIRGQRARKWLPGRDLNPNKQSQNLLCYRYTTGQKDDAVRCKRSGPQLSIRFSLDFRVSHSGIEVSICLQWRFGFPNDASMVPSTDQMLSRELPSCDQPGWMMESRMRWGSLNQRPLIPD